MLRLAGCPRMHASHSLLGMAQVEAWHPCPHLPGCITVNVGDSLQLWSDGVLKSNYHRVRMPEPGEPQVPDLAASSSHHMRCASAAAPLGGWCLSVPHCVRACMRASCL